MKRNDEFYQVAAIRLNNLNSIKLNPCLSTKDCYKQIQYCLNIPFSTAPKVFRYFKEYEIYKKQDNYYIFYMKPCHYTRIRAAYIAYLKHNREYQKTFYKKKCTKNLLNILNDVASLAGYSIESISLKKN